MRPEKCQIALLDKPATPSHNPLVLGSSPSGPIDCQGIRTTL